MIWKTDAPESGGKLEREKNSLENFSSLLLL
jgi:hypothetical protein